MLQLHFVFSCIIIVNGTTLCIDQYPPDNNAPLENALKNYEEFYFEDFEFNER